MDHLPLSDIAMLVSSINFLLRDEEFENIHRNPASTATVPSARQTMIREGQRTLGRSVDSAEDIWTDYVP